MKLKSLVAALAVAGLLASSPMAAIEAQAGKHAKHAKHAMPMKAMGHKGKHKMAMAKKAKHKMAMPMKAAPKKAAIKKPAPGMCGTYKFYKAGKCVDKR